jgi:hypothetical protein
VGAQIVALEEGVVPETVRSDARVEAEVDEDGGREASLVVGPEGEEVVEDIRQIGALGGAHCGAQRSADQPLGREVQRGE